MIKLVLNNKCKIIICKGRGGWGAESAYVIIAVIPFYNMPR